MLRTFALALAVVAAAGSTTFAADLIIPESPEPIMESSGMGLEGLYAGVQVGAFHIEDTQATVGAFIGYNFVTDPLLLGVELQGNYYFEGAYDAAVEWLALGKVGFAVTDSMALYALGGIGHVWQEEFDDYMEYALGAGAQFAVSDAVSLRVNALAIASDESDGFYAAKVTAGALWHF